MKLSKHTIETLRYKADVAADTFDPSDDSTDWCKTAELECKAVAAAGTVEALKASKVAMEELENYRGADMPKHEDRAIAADLCRAGWYEPHDPERVIMLGRKPRMMTVEGVKYVTG